MTARHFGVTLRESELEAEGGELMNTDAEFPDTLVVSRIVFDDPSVCWWAGLAAWRRCALGVCLFAIYFVTRTAPL